MSSHRAEIDSGLGTPGKRRAPPAGRRTRKSSVTPDSTLLLAGAGNPRLIMKPPSSSRPERARRRWGLCCRRRFAPATTTVSSAVKTSRIPDCAIWSVQPPFGGGFREEGVSPPDARRRGHDRVMLSQSLDPGERQMPHRALRRTRHGRTAKRCLVLCSEAGPLLMPCGVGRGLSGGAVSIGCGPVHPMIPRNGIEEGK